MSSVYVRNRKESKWEPIIFSEKMQDEFFDFAKRNFGIKDIKQLVRKKYISGKFDSDDYEFYFSILREHRRTIYQILILLRDDLYSANVYPVTMSDFEQRLQYQNFALVHCSMLDKELQDVVTMFDVDINAFERYQAMIDREIDLIKRWRQRDNRLKARLKTGNV